MAARQEVRDDVKKYKDALTLMFNKQGKLPVFFERNYKTQHLQVHLIIKSKLFLILITRHFAFPKDHFSQGMHITDTSCAHPEVLLEGIEEFFSECCTNKKHRNGIPQRGRRGKFTKIVVTARCAFLQGHY